MAKIYDNPIEQQYGFKYTERVVADDRTEVQSLADLTTLVVPPHFVTFVRDVLDENGLPTPFQWNGLDQTNLANWINPLADLKQRTTDLETTVGAIEDLDAQLSFANIAAATAYWTAAVVKPVDGKELYIQDINDFYKWNSALTPKVEFSRDNITINNGAFNPADNVNPASQESISDHFQPQITNNVNSSLLLDSTKAKKSTNTNLLNPNDKNIRQGYFYNGSGVETANASYTLSGYIPVIAGQELYFPWTVGGESNVLLDEDFNQLTVTQAKPIIVAQNGYARFSVPGNADTWEANLRRVNVGVLASFEKYTEFKEVIDQIKTITSNQDNRIKSLIPRRDNGINLLNPFDDNVVDGYFINSTGGLTANAIYSVSGFIPVKAGETLRSFSDGPTYKAFYDLNFNQVEVHLASEVAKVAPQDGYFRTTVNATVANWHSAAKIVLKGTVALPYEQYYEGKSNRDYTLSKVLSQQTQWTNDDAINVKIKGLYFIGLNPAKNYYFRQFTYRSSDNYRLYILVERESGLDVSRVFTDLSKRDGEYHLFEAQNSSNITGYIFVDETSFFTNDGIDKPINIEICSTKNEYIKNFFEQDFLERDTTIRRNKLNPLDISLLTTWTVSFGHLLVTKTASTFFNTTKIFPLANNESITISNESLFQCNAWIINAERKVLKTVSISENNFSSSVQTVLNDTGENAWIAFILRTNSAGADIGQYHQVEYGTGIGRILYEGYLFNPMRTETVELVLPKNNYLVVGEKYNIYKKSILKANPNRNLDVYFRSNSDSSSFNFPRQIYGLPTSAGAGTIDIVALDNFRTLSRTRPNFERLSKQTGTITLFPLGDSFTDINIWISELMSKSADDSVTINTIGLKGKTATNSFSENQTGGTIANSFLVSRGDAFLLAVTGFINDNTTDGFSAAVYSDGTSNYIFDGRKVDGSGNGVIRLVRSGVHANNPAPNGTLTKVSGTSNFNTIEYTTVEVIDRNPLWNGTAIDFTYYFEKYGYDIDYDLTTNKFVLSMMFSWNDVSDFYNKGNVDTVVANFKTVVDKFHEQYPNAKVIVAVEPTSALNFGASNNTRGVAAIQWARLEFAKALFELFENSTYSSFVYVVPAYAYVDTENAFTFTNEVLDDRFPSTTVRKTGDPTHPTTSGMGQIADAFYPVIQKIVRL